MVEGEDRLRRKAGNYFLRHWRGELSLGVSFWVNGVLGFFLLAGIAKCLPMSTGVGSLKAAAAIDVLFSTLSLLALLWQAVGIWHSALKQVERRGRRTWGAELAKLAVLAFVLERMLILTKLTVPYAIEDFTILTGDKRIAPYEIRVLAGGKEVEFYGGIRAGAARALEGTLNTLPQVTVLHVNSTGGRGHEAKKMARSVKERNLITYTSEQCLSAVTLVLIAGKERVMDANAGIGFHGGMAGTTIERRSDNRSFGEAMRAAGISSEFINRVVATPNDGMWCPSYEEMLRAGVVTSRSFGDRFAVSGSRLRRSSPHDLDEDYGNRPWFRAVKEVEPAIYDRMLHDTSAAVQSGKTRVEVQKVFQLVSDQLWAKYSTNASDNTLLMMRDLWIAKIETVADNDLQASTAIEGLKTPDAPIDHGLFDSEETRSNNIVLIETVLRGAAKDPVPRVDNELADKDAAAVQSKLRQIYGADADLISKPEEWMQKPQRTRELLLAFYKETKKIPTERQCNLLRSMVPSHSSQPMIRR